MEWFELDCGLNHRNIIECLEYMKLNQRILRQFTDLPDASAENRKREYFKGWLGSDVNYTFHFLQLKTGGSFSILDFVSQCQ